jgi:hypothetical protein
VKDKERFILILLKVLEIKDRKRMSSREMGHTQVVLRYGVVEGLLRGGFGGRLKLKADVLVVWFSVFLDPFSVKSKSNGLRTDRVE